MDNVYYNNRLKIEEGSVLFKHDYEVSSYIQHGGFLH